MENKNKTLLISLFIAICHFSREFADFKDFDRFLGISSISRILKEYLPWNSKIASGVTFSSSSVGDVRCQAAKQEQARNKLFFEQKPQQNDNTLFQSRVGT